MNFKKNSNAVKDFTFLLFISLLKRPDLPINTIFYDILFDHKQLLWKIKYAAFCQRPKYLSSKNNKVSFLVFNITE